MQRISHIFLASFSVRTPYCGEKRALFFCSPLGSNKNSVTARIPRFRADYKSTVPELELLVENNPLGNYLPLLSLTRLSLNPICFKKVWHILLSFASDAPFLEKVLKPLK